jgi:hypothetical protein
VLPPNESLTVRKRQTRSEKIAPVEWKDAGVLPPNEILAVRKRQK